MNFKTLLFSFFILSLIFMMACDPHTPPAIEFKTGVNYTSKDTTVAKGTSILVGIKATKREDAMKRYNISYSYDGSSTTNTKESFTLSGSEEVSYEKDYTFNVRNQAGIENWYFVITDKDGNIAKLQLKLTVN
jgi:hypothetical protein